MSCAWLALACAATVLQLLCTARADVYYKAFPAFSALQTSLPSEGNLIPSPNNRTFDVSLSGPRAVVEAFQPVLNGGTLSLGFRSGIRLSTTSAVNYTVRVPEGALQAISVAGSGSFEGNGRAASASRLTMIAAGAGLLSFVEVVAPAVSVNLAGSASVIVEGDDLRSMSLVATGAGVAQFSGLSGNALVQLAGSSSAYFHTQGGASQITGNVVGVSKVYYDGGRCSVTGVGFGSPCIAGPVPLPY